MKRGNLCRSDVKALRESIRELSCRMTMLEVKAARLEDLIRKTKPPEPEDFNYEEPEGL